MSLLYVLVAFGLAVTLWKYREKNLKNRKAQALLIFGAFFQLFLSSLLGQNEGILFVGSSMASTIFAIYLLVVSVYRLAMFSKIIEKEKVAAPLR